MWGCAYVCGPCCHQRPHGCLGSRPHSVTRLVSGTMAIWVVNTVSWGHGVHRDRVAAEGCVWVCNPTPVRVWQLMSMTPVATKSLVDVWGLPCHLRTCWYSRAMWFPGLYWYGLPVLPLRPWYYLGQSCGKGPCLGLWTCFNWGLW